MATMPRIPGKAKRIAFDILGKPANMQKQKESERQRWIRDRLVAEDTRLGR